MTGVSSNLSSASWRRVSFALLMVVSFQWIVATYFLIEHHHDQQHHLENGTKEGRLYSQGNDPSIIASNGVGNSVEMLQTISDTTGGIVDKQNLAQYDGVAVTLMLRAPKWFHRRYTTMLHNVLSNLPSEPSSTIKTGRGWAVQVVVNMPWLEKDVFPLHPGLRRLLKPTNTSTPTSSTRTDDGAATGKTTFATTYGGHDIYVTELPLSMTKLKPKQIFKSTWFWESLLVDPVLMFSGNGAFCANHDLPTKLTSPSVSLLNKLALEDRWDYVGIPWNRFYGRGGDGGTHSLRRKSAMLRILSAYPSQARDQDPDSVYFVKYMLESLSNKQQKQNTFYPYKVADIETTKIFGGVSTMIDSVDNTKEIIDGHPPMVVSGTMANLNWSARDNLLQICPELKVIFPSLHEPNCFGAHPNGEKCRATICALQEKIPGHGC